MNTPAAKSDIYICQRPDSKKYSQGMCGLSLSLSLGSFDFQLEWVKNMAET